ncbi:MAG: bifunctional alpha,alpha-trehalose-phosphate synthase (UDP-forming)/trehalose-phosphatase [Oligoflexales bacterium]
MYRSQTLIIVSNRLPVTVTRANDQLVAQPSSGGLVTGLRSVYERENVLWVGHAGVFSDDNGFSELSEDLRRRRLVTVEVGKSMYDRYYHGTSNGAVWPLFHYFPEAMNFSFEDWNAYKKANERFAEKVLEVANPGDLVWVHDYQLMLLPSLLRQSRKDLRIAYFHHIPFPAYEIFRMMPVRKELLEGLLGADYIGFHNYDYMGHFLLCVSRLLGHEVHIDEIHYPGHTIKAGVHPLGIDYEAIQTIMAEQQEQNRILRDLKTEILLLGVDRLDYSKGILEKIRGFGEFLRKYPAFVGRTVLLQLCVPSRADIPTYGDLKAEVERLVGQINGEFGMPGYSPVQYLYRSVSQEDLFALYRAADVAIVTPLRDGLNLVCKEYVAARTNEDGVLILSEFAGASAEMGEAILVNPFDIRSVSNAIFQAVTMRRELRRSKMLTLRARVKTYDNVAWADRFMVSWSNHTSTVRQTSQRIDPATLGHIRSSVVLASKCYMFLDNDGTLTPIARRPELAIPSAEVQASLARIGRCESLEVTVVTGRPRDFCEQYFFGLPVNIFAEHAAYFCRKGENTWQEMFAFEESPEVRREILNLLNFYKGFVAASHVEVKETSFVWHYRESEPVFASWQAKELVSSLHLLLQNTSYAVYHGRKMVEVKPAMAHKGFAVEHVVRQGNESDFSLITIGDDTTDEDMYKTLRDKNISIHMGQQNAYAKYYLDSGVDFPSFLTDLIPLPSQGQAS